MEKSLGSGTRPRWFGFLFLGLALVSVGVGCGMFDIRDPVAPPNPKGLCAARFASPGSAESVLFNFAQSFRCQEAALGQFGETLAEGFHLDLDDRDAADIGTGIDSLSKDLTVEGQRLRSVEASTDSFAFAFEFGKESDSGGRDQTAYYLDIPYTLRIGHSQNDSLIVTKTISGTSDVFLAEGGLASQWFITRWVDQRGDSTSLGRWYGDKVGSSQAAQSP